MKKSVKSGITLAAALTMVAGGAAAANANEVGIMPLATTGWLNCEGFGVVSAIGTLRVTGIMTVTAVERTMGWSGNAGASRTVHSIHDRGGWEVTGPANGDARCD